MGDVFAVAFTFAMLLCGVVILASALAAGQAIREALARRTARRIARHRYEKRKRPPDR